MTLADVLIAAGIAAVLAGCALALAWREQLHGADEGYLAYGVQRTLAGEVPLRDFRSYEPGRYYWCALWLRLAGFGLVRLRGSVHAFYALGLTCGLLALRVGGMDWPVVVGTGVVVAAWAYQPHKLFEPALAMAVVLCGTLVVVHHDVPAFVWAGVAIGVSTTFGLNYGSYAGGALVVLTGLVIARAPEVTVLPALAFLVVGALLGTLPLLISFAVFPDVARRVWDLRVRAVLGRGSSNLPLPVPWPWRPRPAHLAHTPPPAALLVQLLFAALPLLAGGAVLWSGVAAWPTVQAHPVLAAGGVTALFTMHHAFSRADVGHLATAIPPALLAVVGGAGPSAVGAGLAVVVLSCATLPVVMSAHPRMMRRLRAEEFTRTPLWDSWVWCHHVDRATWETVQAVVATHLEPDDCLVAVPTLVTLLAVTRRRSAVYDTFCVYPATPAEQLRMVREMRSHGVRVVIVKDAPLDGREELRFRSTHPDVWAHLDTAFRRIEALPRGVAVRLRPPRQG